MKLRCFIPNSELLGNVSIYQMLTKFELQQLLLLSYCLYINAIIVGLLAYIILSFVVFYCCGSLALSCLHLE